MDIYMKWQNKERADRVLQEPEATHLISISVKSAIIFKPEIKIITKA
ncbi:MAG TPA: hypothetical protein VF411_10835 [Bacteroidia bacterium]